MKFLRVSLIIFVIGSLLAVSGCVGKEYDEDAIDRPDANIDQNAALSGDEMKDNSATDDEAALGAAINLPFVPIKNVWQTSTGNVGSNGATPANDSLTAVLQFSPEDTNLILQKLSLQGKGNDQNIEPDDWFPEEIIADGDTQGDSAVSGKAFSAKDFVKPPYKSGTITYLPDTNYFVVTLSTK